MLHLAPDLVDMSRRHAQRARAARRQPVRALRRPGRLRLAVERLRRPTATSATRRAATAEHGKELFDGAVDAFCEALAEIAAFDSGRWHDRSTVTDDLRIDIDRLLARIDELGEIGADRRARTASGAAPAGADRRRPRRPRPRRRRGCATSGSTVADRRDRQRRSPPAPARTRPAAPVMTGSHIDTVAHGRPLRRQPRRARRARGGRDARAARHRDRAPDRRWRSSPTRRARASRPTCSAASCTSAGWPLEEALDVRAVDDGARLGDELARIGYAGPGAVPDGARRRTRSSSCTSSRVRSWRTRASTIGVVEGVQGISWTELTITGQSAHAGTTPMRLRRDPGYVAGRDRRRSSRDSTRRDRRRPGRHRRPARAAPEPGQRRAGDGARSPSTCATPTTTSLQEAERRFATTSSSGLAAAEGVTIVDAGRWPASSRSSSIRRWSTAVEATARRLGHSTRRMPSGAGHDAQMLARRVPDGDDLRAERRRAVATTSPSTPNRPTSKPAPTCCSTWCSTNSARQNGTDTPKLHDPADAPPHPTV